MKEIDHYQQVRRAAIAILNYLRDHPTAKDTLPGIAKFWVGENEEIVIDALTLLIKEGVLEQRSKVYQLTKLSGATTDNLLIEKILQSLN